ncbi:MAG: M48 family metallopeptidase [Candidatus Diapherotrites archaeon]|uniref:Protease HtpX homolog n=1 Tax=Candidatus Iainarchaeum sp. TaxID=3101447 RepID=A0A939C8P4_9ARCH|nr:M48 family metallopeptidase [Candidatus Diapherotrites archaeon]
MSFYEEISSNNRMTYFLFIIFFFLIIALGIVVSFATDFYFFVPLFGIIAIIYILVSYYNSDRIVTAISKAKPADEQKFKQLHNIVEEMALAAGLPKPKVYVIEDTAINAFATGRNPEHSVVCVTTGAVQFLNRAELTGVVAHEMSHIRNRDIKVMTMAAILVGLAVLLSDFLLRMFVWGGVGGRGRSEKGGALVIAAIALGVILAILTPLIAQMIKFAISRKREYLADASAVQLTRYPQGLIGALNKIDNDKEPLEAANKATAHLYIANPLKGQKLWMKSMFSTHPPIGDRVARLQKM